MTRIAVLISGSGTTLRNLIEWTADGRLAVKIVQVISSNVSAAGLRFAQEAEIPSQVIQRGDFANTESFSRAIFSVCTEFQTDLVVMGGFLAHVLVPPAFQGRVMNIHPALIPAFCGRGYYGRRVHEAVLEHGAKVTGCTVHFVDDEYDHGPIILQRCVPVEPHDSPESLAERVFTEECEAYPEAIRLFAEDRLRITGHLVRILGK